MNSELDDLLERLEQELAAEDGALERIQLLRTNPRHITVGVCPDCFIRSGFHVEMIPQDPNSGNDVFECSKGR
jgi:hypothetical protein